MQNWKKNEKINYNFLGYIGGVLKGLDTHVQQKIFLHNKRLDPPKPLCLNFILIQVKTDIFRVKTRHFFKLFKLWKNQRTPENDQK